MTLPRTAGILVLALCWPATATIAGEPVQTGTASYYGAEACRWNPNPGCPTADGSSLYELERQQVPYAAMWDVPFGSRWQVCRADQPTRCVEVVCRDRGPHKRLHRLIDLNARSFAQLAPRSAGVLAVTVERVP